MTNGTIVSAFIFFIRLTLQQPMFPSYTNHSVALLCNQGTLVVKGLNQEAARALKLFCRRCDLERSGFRNLDLKNKRKF